MKQTAIVTRRMYSGKQRLCVLVPVDHPDGTEISGIQQGSRIEVEFGPQSDLSEHERSADEEAEAARMTPEALDGEGV